jgi:phage gp16-like protein
MTSATVARPKVQAQPPSRESRGARFAAAERALEIKLIQIGRRQLQLDDDTYRALLRRLCAGKESSKELTAYERKKVLAHYRASGFVVKPKPGSARAAEDGWARAPQMRKLRAMWYVLAEAGHVETPATTQDCNAAIEAWAKARLNAASPQPALGALRFASSEQMNELVEQLKRWLGRLGLPTRAG